VRNCDGTIEGPSSAGGFEDYIEQQTRGAAANVEKEWPARLLPMTSGKLFALLADVVPCDRMLNAGSLSRFGSLGGVKSWGLSNWPCAIRRFTLASRAVFRPIPQAFHAVAGNGFPGKAAR
jgi:hypothetical protein